MLEDLQCLISHPDNAPVQSGQRTATERRAEVMRLLSNLDTAGLSDREIARRVGVSPQTIGNIRRRIKKGRWSHLNQSSPALWRRRFAEELIEIGMIVP